MLASFREPFNFVASCLGRMLEKSGKQVSNVSFACRRPFGNGGMCVFPNIFRLNRDINILLSLNSWLQHNIDMVPVKIAPMLFMVS